MIDLIFEDNHQLVLNKPAGLLTQPSGTDQESLEFFAKSWLKQKYSKQGNVFLEAVHRIDKPVSGIVLFAKTSKALSRLHEALREGKTEKTYLAIVEGNVLRESAILEHFLVHDDFHASISNQKNPAAKKAILEYRVIKRMSDGKSLLEIKLITGRYHQIRVQLAAIGHPIWGDERYGSCHRLAVGNSIALHHSLFCIPHPITGEKQTFEAPLPVLFKNFG